MSVVANHKDESPDRSSWVSRELAFPWIIKPPKIFLVPPQANGQGPGMKSEDG
jgi:hypothetical protein